MNAIIITTVLGEDRRLHLDINLPPDTPVGTMKVTIEPNNDVAPDRELTRDEVRERLLAAGALSTATYAPRGAVRLSDEEILRLGKLPPGARPSDELIDEDRGPR